MVKVLFVCHGNICRSVAAEMITRHLLEQMQLWNVEVASAAVSNEETGNGIYPPMKRVLEKHNIKCIPHAARKMTAMDYCIYDLLIGMDSDNMWRMQDIAGGDHQGKMHLLLEYADGPDKEVSDPWYTRDFEKAYQDILRGCEGLVRFIQKEKE